MATTYNVGKTATIQLSFFDTNGAPMVTMPTLDAPPVWSNVDQAVEILQVAADGLSAVVSALADGNDTVSISLTVDGEMFSTTVDFTVSSVAPQQVLGSIGTTVTVNP